MGVRITLFAMEQTKVESHLQRYEGDAGNPYGLRDWLIVRSNITASDIRQISDGHRRWWMGSVLDKIRETWTFNKDEYECTRACFAKILQGHDCGSDRKHFAQSITPPPGLLASYSDLDLQIGFLNSNEVELLLTLFCELLESEDCQFHRLEITTGIVSAHEEWDSWVKDRIAEILSIQRLNYQEPCVVSFIG